MASTLEERVFNLERQWALVKGLQSMGMVRALQVMTSGNEGHARMLLQRIDELQLQIDVFREYIEQSILDKEKGNQARYDWSQGMTDHDKSMT